MLPGSIRVLMRNIIGWQLLIMIFTCSSDVFAFGVPFSFWASQAAPTGPVWYSGITYSTSGWNYGSCTQPDEASMNDEAVGAKSTWGSASGVGTQWMVADLGSSKTVEGIRVGGNGPSSCWASAASYWTGAIVEVSVNGVAWTQVASGIAYSNSVMTNVGFASTTARYVRLSNSGWFAVGQFRVGTGIPAPPPDPSSPIATVDSDTQITVSWTTGGGTTASFKVAYQVGATAPGHCGVGTVVTSTNSPKAISGLTASTQYSFRICSVSSQNVVSGGITTTATTTGQCGAGKYRNGGICENVGYGYYSPANDDNRYVCNKPANTKDEWSGSSQNFSFLVAGGCYTCLDSHRYDSGSGTCVADPCSGRSGPVSFAGYNWYTGATGESCDTLCAAYGKTTDLNGTRDYAGSGGTFANCIAVYNALGCPARNPGYDGPDDGTSNTIGCFTYHAWDTQPVLRRYTGTTVGSSAWLNRICACTP